MPVTKRYLIRDAETSDLISYGNLSTTQKTLHHLLWTAYTDHVGLQKVTDPEKQDSQHRKDGEPVYLGTFEDARDTIANNIDLWTRPDHWNYAMHYAKIKIFIVDPDRKFRDGFPSFKPWHEPEISGPLPTDQPESDVDTLLQDFFAHEEAYMTQPDLPIGDIIPDEVVDMFIDGWYQDHPEDWPDGDK
ncbi:hypothetical protein [Lacticaseibacillus jixiensis]|uniref:hypothetical protein n=1 Tax=Lacticaseibacillus jixiensis TaxID=3231926 RepID=UPI0036F39375